MSRHSTEVSKCACKELSLDVSVQLLIKASLERHRNRCDVIVMNICITTEWIDSGLTYRQILLNVSISCCWLASRSCKRSCKACWSTARELASADCQLSILTRADIYCLCSWSIAQSVNHTETGLKRCNQCANALVVPLNFSNSLVFSEK